METFLFIVENYNKNTGGEVLFINSNISKSYPEILIFMDYF